MDEEISWENIVEEIDKVLENYGDKKNELIQVLLDIQENLGWVPEAAIDRISGRLDIPKSEVFRVGSFYKGINLEPIGDHLVQVCLGTACTVRGAERIYEKVQDVLGLEGEGTTSDKKFTLRSVSCLGCCAIGPVMVVDDEYYGKIGSNEVEEVLEEYE